MWISRFEDVGCGDVDPRWSQTDPGRNQDGAQVEPETLQSHGYGKRALRDGRCDRRQPPGVCVGGLGQCYKCSTVFGVPLGYVNWLDPIDIVILSLQIG